MQSMLLLLFVSAVLASVGAAAPFDLVGTLEVNSRCYQQGSTPEEIYMLYVDGGAPTRLYVDGNQHAPQPGLVRVFGTVVDGHHNVAGWSHRAGSGPAKRRRRVNTGKALDIQNPNVIFIRLDMPGLVAACPESELSEIMWHGASNAKDFWAEMTYGHVQFVTDLDGNGKDDIVSVRLDAQPPTCEDVYPAMMAALRTQLPDVDVSRWERQVMVLPTTYAACGFGGASIGCPVGFGCKVWLTKCKEFPDSIVHELGHTLGLRHGAGISIADAGRVDDYEDRSTIMGYSYHNKPRRGLNSVHRLSVGMRAGNAVELSAGFVGAQEIWSLAYPDTESEPKLKVAQIALGGVTYYLSYRMPVAGTYDADIASPDLEGRLGPVWAGRIAIHSQTLPAHSFVHAMIAPGQTWTAPGTAVQLAAEASATPDRTIVLRVSGLCGNGVVDGGEQCDGGDCCTAQCTFRGADHVCRTAFGVCDVVETCSGAAAACPANTFAPATKLCRPANLGPCDVDDYCDGNGVCPFDSRPDGSACDLAECAMRGTGTCFSRQCLGICGAPATTDATTKTTSPAASTAGPQLTTSKSATPAASSSSTTAAPSIASCGDGVCNAFEDCSSCAADCPRGTSALGSGFCCAAWGCEGRGCPALSLTRSTCHLGNDVRLCKSSGVTCAATSECCDGRCFHGTCK